MVYMDVGTALFLLSLAWVFKCFKDLKKDISLLNLLKEGQESHYTSELTVFILSWIISVLLLIFYIIPNCGRYLSRIYIW